MSQVEVETTVTAESLTLRPEPVVSLAGGTARTEVTAANATKGSVPSVAIQSQAQPKAGGSATVTSGSNEQGTSRGITEGDKGQIIDGKWRRGKSLEAYSFLHMSLAQRLKMAAGTDYLLKEYRESNLRILRRSRALKRIETHKTNRQQTFVSANLRFRSRLLSGLYKKMENLVKEATDVYAAWLNFHTFVQAIDSVVAEMTEEDAKKVEIFVDVCHDDLRRAEEELEETVQTLQGKATLNPNVLAKMARPEPGQSRGQTDTSSDEEEDPPRRRRKKDPPGAPLQQPEETIQRSAVTRDDVNQMSQMLQDVSKRRENQFSSTLRLEGLLGPRGIFNPTMHNPTSYASDTFRANEATTAAAKAGVRFAGIPDPPSRPPSGDLYIEEHFPYGPPVVSHGVTRPPNLSPLAPTAPHWHQGEASMETDDPDAGGAELLSDDEDLTYYTLPNATLLPDGRGEGFAPHRSQSDPVPPFLAGAGNLASHVGRNPCTVTGGVVGAPRGQHPGHSQFGQAPGAPPGPSSAPGNIGAGNYGLGAAGEPPNMGGGGGYSNGYPSGAPPYGASGGGYQPGGQGNPYNGNGGSSGGNGGGPPGGGYGPPGGGAGPPGGPPGGNDPPGGSGPPGGGPPGGNGRPGGGPPGDPGDPSGNGQAPGYQGGQGPNPNQVPPQYPFENRQQVNPPPQAYRGFIPFQPLQPTVDLTRLLHEPYFGLMRNTYDITKAFPVKYDGKTDWQDFKLTYMDQEQYMCNLGFTMAQRLAELKKVVKEPLIHYIREYKLEDGNYLLAMQQLERICSDRRAYILKEMLKMYKCTPLDGTTQSRLRLHAQFSAAIASQRGLKLSAEDMIEILRINALESYYDSWLKDTHGKWMQLHRSDKHPTGYNVNIDMVMAKLESMNKHLLRMGENPKATKYGIDLKSVAYHPSSGQREKRAASVKDKSRKKLKQAKTSLPSNFATQAYIDQQVQQAIQRLPQFLPRAAVCVQTQQGRRSQRQESGKTPVAAAAGPMKVRGRAASVPPQSKNERVPCYICNNTLNHAFPLRCPQLKKANKTRIHALVREKRLCRNCLGPGHTAESCTAAASIKCPKRNCGKRHSIFFHPGYTDAPRKPTSAGSSEALVQNVIA